MVLGVDGESSYACQEYSNVYTNFGFSYDAEIAGGTIKTIHLPIEVTSGGYPIANSVTANGKDIDFDQWEFVTNIIRAFNPKSNIQSQIRYK